MKKDCNKIIVKAFSLNELMRNCRDVNPLFFWGVILLFLIIVFLFYIFIVPDADKQNKRKNEVIFLNKFNIISINIKEDTNTDIIQQNQFNYNITDEKIVYEFCKALSTVYKITPDHPVILVKYVITIKYPNCKTIFQVSSVDGKGYYIYIYSNESNQDGWIYGIYTSKVFSDFMESFLTSIRRESVQVRRDKAQ